MTECPRNIVGRPCSIRKVTRMFCLSFTRTGHSGTGWSSRAERRTRRTHWACWILTAANSTLPGSAATWPADEVRQTLSANTREAKNLFFCLRGVSVQSLYWIKFCHFHQMPGVSKLQGRIWTFVTAWHLETENHHWVFKDIKESTPESRLWWLVDPQHVEYIRLKRGEALRCSLIGLRASSAGTLTKEKKGKRFRFKIELWVRLSSIVSFRPSCLLLTVSQESD